MSSDRTVSVLDDQISGMILSVQVQVPKFEVHLSNVGGRERIRRTHNQSRRGWRHFRTRVFRGQSNCLQPCPSAFHYLQGPAKEPYTHPRDRKGLWLNRTLCSLRKNNNNTTTRSLKHEAHGRLTHARRNKNCSGSKFGARTAAAKYVSGSCLSKVSRQVA